MHFIDPKTIPVSKWVNRSGLGFCPDAVGTKCPYCNQSVFLRVTVIGQQSFVPEIQSFGLKGVCPSCEDDNSIQVFFVEVSKDQENPHCKEIWVNPAPKVRIGIVDELPDLKVFNYYKQSIEAFNHGLWSLALLTSSRAAEIICKTMFCDGSEQKDVIGIVDETRSRLQQTPSLKNILEPLLTVADALHVGRDPDEYFDLEVEPNQDLADKVLDLTEFLIKSLYIIFREASEVSHSKTELGLKDAERPDILNRMLESFS